MSHAPFNELPVSINTIGVLIMISIDLKKFFDSLEVIPYVLNKKRRGRKPTGHVEAIVSDPADGAIYLASYNGQTRGHRNKPSSKENKYWPNSISLDLWVDGKSVNMKIPREGVINITGCRSNAQCEKCVDYLIQRFMAHPDCWRTDHPTIRAYFVKSMRNITFSIGIRIKQRELKKYINSNTEFTALYDPSFGHTDVNIKKPITESIMDLKVKYREYEKDSGMCITDILVPLKHYLDLLTSNKSKKKMEKPHHNTFRVFYEGKVNMSGINTYYMEEAYNRFLRVIDECRETIEDTSV